jgi:hypothetical protein
MCERSFGYTVLLAALFAAVIFGSQCSARSGGNIARLDTGRTSATQRQELAYPHIAPIAPAFESERSCTYRGGPKSGFWSCQ